MVVEIWDEIIEDEVEVYRACTSWIVGVVGVSTSDVA
jgi:hypothetical protein